MNEISVISNEELYFRVRHISAKVTAEDLHRRYGKEAYDKMIKTVLTYSMFYDQEAVQYAKKVQMELEAIKL